ncbi:hypothetical protein LPB140_11475 [Sphingorhabdus lutea]|uniref:CSD domain-containing protein n=1 Tax=Sphingorhabdus lutea TaxID=1913578 RepID=A0A1L3JDT1_9SPHN|nr:cold shock protein [Sphingorhabdus lutea]APG63301.1 hypothetical protein LPB140_11475 [Sphingorhabdus lutea]
MAEQGASEPRGRDSGPYGVDEVEDIIIFDSNNDVQIDDKENDAIDSAAIIHGKVKWFDRKRGFGFIQTDNGGADIMIHSSLLEEHGRRELPDGCPIKIIAEQGKKGLFAAQIIEFDAGVENVEHHIAPPSPNLYLPFGDNINSTLAKVKWFSKVKGYGFLESKKLNKDIFVHMEIMRLAGILEIDNDMALNVHYEDSAKGPLALEVRLPPKGQD